MIDHMIWSPEIEVDGYMLTHPHQDGMKGNVSKREN